MDESCTGIKDSEGEGIQWWEVCGDVHPWGDKWVVVLGFYEVLVADDGGGEVFVVVGSCGGDDGECGGNEGGLVWWGPREVSWFWPHVDDCC